MNKIKNKNGFTLIELLAVIIILGVLLLIAIPSISKYIENSRKSTYINSVKSIVSAVSTSVNALELPYSIGKDEGLIVPFSEVNLEKSVSKTKSPYSKWVPNKSYILIVFDGEMYRYFVSALDEAGYGIPLVNDKELTTSSITTNKATLDSSLVSYQDIIDNKNTVYDLPVVTMKYNNNSGNIVKVKIGYSEYSKGDIIQLKDGSKWYTTVDSTFEENTITLLSYYMMLPYNGFYGMQDSNEDTPSATQTFNNISANDYELIEKIVNGLRVKLQEENIDVGGADIQMPEIEDFGCSNIGCRVANFFKGGGSGSGPFWTNSVVNNNVYYVSKNNNGGIVGTASFNKNSIGIRIVMRNFKKSNIDKQATKALN